MKNAFLNIVIGWCLFIIPALTGCSDKKINNNNHAITPMVPSTQEYPGSLGVSKKQSDNTMCCKKK